MGDGQSDAYKGSRDASRLAAKLEANHKREEVLVASVKLASIRKKISELSLEAVALEKELDSILS